MHMSGGRTWLAALALLAAGTAPAQALDRFAFDTPGADADLHDLLAAASLTREAATADVTDPQGLFAAARADYGRILGALYAEGYYSAVISIRIDGRETAAIPPLDAPASIRAVDIVITPGPRFDFARAAIAPIAPGTDLPDGFAPGKPARSGQIVAAATAGIDGWRRQGHAKARVAGQTITADHRAQTLDPAIALDPGPRVRFGTLRTSGYDRLDPRRLAKIAGFPTGEVFDPAKLDQVRARLRRTGIFSSVTLTEAEALSPGPVLDADLAVVEQKPRRIGFGGELSTLDGLTVSGYWLHRNLLGGGERFRIEGEVAGIGGTTGGEDYTLGLRIDRPATLSPDTSAYLETEIARVETDDYLSDEFSFGLGFDHIFNDRLTASAGLRYSIAKVRENGSRRTFEQLALPLNLTFDNRDNALDATRGYYAAADLTPFLGLGTTGSGAQIKADLRGYRGFGADDRFVIAGRAQIGAVYGSTLLETPRDYLFYSGGGGTVRGQPYESLGVNVLRGGDQRTGGTKFLALSGELRADVTRNIGVVAFYDAGYVGAVDFFDDAGDWHSGAGLGLRYNTGIGPIRLDVAAPVSGGTEDGVQIYLGIGQAF
ncbi:autotransporter assembly complex protein TamA [Pontitalea aquivivens]|uniref:autotransporter assembly complex protein TamA n=1 Tax=Pontitalea aquivivens TaxID=3388663 RepID=UPI0039707415